MVNPLKMNISKEINRNEYRNQKNTEKIIIEVAGRLDTTTAPNLDKAIKDDIADAENLVLD